MPDPKKFPLIIAHRGASAHAPENTFAAFQMAIDGGVGGIEFDVRLARDGVAVVFHDETLKRTGRRHEKIYELTSAELAETDIGSWFNAASPKRARPDFAGETVKTLAETLDFFADFKGRIYIELKCTAADARELTAAVCSLICDSPLLPQVIVKSFTLAVIPHVQNFCPKARTAALFGPKIRTVFRKQKYIVDLAVQLGADELSLHYSLATRRLTKLAARQNLPVTIWTADNPKWLNRAVKRGIFAIMQVRADRSTITSP